jgi:hypothetical protein
LVGSGAIGVWYGAVAFALDLGEEILYALGVERAADSTQFVIVQRALRLLELVDVHVSNIRPEKHGRTRVQNQLVVDVAGRDSIPRCDTCRHSRQGHDDAVSNSRSYWWVGWLAG